MLLRETDLMRYLTTQLKNNYCSIIVANHKLITIIIYVTQCYVHLWKNFANKFCFVFHACKITFVAQVALAQPNCQVAVPLKSNYNTNSLMLHWLCVRRMYQNFHVLHKGETLKNDVWAIARPKQHFEMGEEHGPIKAG